jgi:hypothetical protein
MIVNPILERMSAVGRKENSKFRLLDWRWRTISKTMTKRESDKSCTLLNPDNRYSGVSSKMNCGS